MVTHLDSDILECKVKCGLGSITTNKASEGDGLLAELFKILKDDAVEVLHTICQQIWKTQQWPQDWKMPVFSPIPKKGSAKKYSNYYTLHSFHMLPNECSKLSKLGFNSPEPRISRCSR